MVAYSFKTGFAAEIIAGRKRQTIRRHRRRHARKGEPVQLFTGMRTRSCRKLIEPDPVCISVDNIVIWVPEADEIGFGCAYYFADRQQVVDSPVDDDFAQADGFPDARHFTRFWQLTHGAGLFEGVLIRWELGA